MSDLSNKSQKEQVVSAQLVEAPACLLQAGILPKEPLNKLKSPEHALLPA